MDHGQGAAASRDESGLRDRWEQIDSLGDHQEALLDEALEETFPASDPISPVRVGNPSLGLGT
jgi:hypothetical protein